MTYLLAAAVAADAAGVGILHTAPTGPLSLKALPTHHVVLRVTVRVRMSISATTHASDLPLVAVTCMQNACEVFDQCLDGTDSVSAHAIVLSQVSVLCCSSVLSPAIVPWHTAVS